MLIDGVNLQCPDPPACKDLTVRFGNPEGEGAIYVPAQQVSPTQVKCKIPKYTKPAVLPVELSLNGQDYTNDNLTYGFYDPYVIDAQPRLIAVDGTTEITIKGIGFIDSGETKALYNNVTAPIKCDNQDCIKPAKFVDENHLLTTTFPQAKVLYPNKESVMWDPMNIEVSVYSNKFTDNRIQVFYYEEPEYLPGFDTETPQNIPTDLIVGAKMNPRDVERIRRYGDPKCRFKAANGTEIITNAILIHTPLRSAIDKRSADQEPNAIKCKTPVWDKTEPVAFDISINGQNFKGGFTFYFTDRLQLDRTVPMAGPFTGKSHTRLIGTGFRT